VYLQLVEKAIISDSVYLQLVEKAIISDSICSFGASKFRLSEFIMIEEFDIVSC
jgi:hypothetical protein